MPEPTNTTGIYDAVEETLIIGFKLPAAIAPKLDDYLGKVLESKEFQDALKAAADDIAQAYVKAAPTGFTPEQSSQFAQAFAKKGLTAFQKNLTTQLKSDPQFRRLEESAKGIVTAFKNSPAGVWVDKNKLWLYISGALIATGGVAALYAFRTGDAVTEPLMSFIKDEKVKLVEAGELKLEASGFKFVPAKREVGLDLRATGDWKAVKAELKVTGYALDTKFAVAGAGKVVIPFGASSAHVEAGFDPREKQQAPLRLGMGMDFKQGNLTINLLGQLQAQDGQVTRSSLEFGLTTKGRLQNTPYKAGLTGKADNTGNVSVMGTFSLEF